jgi:hypothetical protein
MLCAMPIELFLNILTQLKISYNNINGYFEKTKEI